MVTESNDTNESSIVRRAIILANKAHEGDLWGEHPYATHLALTALEIRAIEPQAPNAEAAAWLHDVIEDHPEYESRVRKDFPEIYEALIIVSRKDNETYDQFIQRVLDSENELAIKLKLADMTVNLSNNPAKSSLRKRYEKNIVKLQNRVLNYSQEV